MPASFNRTQYHSHGCNDKDAEALAERLFTELGDVPFFIARVEKRPSVYGLPSPDIDR